MKIIWQKINKYKNHEIPAISFFLFSEIKKIWKSSIICPQFRIILCVSMYSFADTFNSRDSVMNDSFLGWQLFVNIIVVGSRFDIVVIFVKMYFSKTSYRQWVGCLLCGNSFELSMNSRSVSVHENIYHLLWKIDN